MPNEINKEGFQSYDVTRIAVYYLSDVILVNVSIATDT